MTGTTKAVLVAGSALAVVLTAYGIRQARTSDPPTPAAHRCLHPPPRAAAAAEPVSPEALGELQSELRQAASDRPSELNALQERLSQDLAEGRLTAEQILNLFRSETDPAVLDLLQGVLALHPEAADGPGVLDAFLEWARTDALPARRQAAIAYLGSAWDKDDRVRDLLFSIARAESRGELRLTALATLQSYAIKNAEQAAFVNAGLLAYAQQEATAEVRAQALGAFDASSAGEEDVGHLAGFLSDPSPEARLAAAEKLGDVPAARRATLLPALERALEREAASGVKEVLLWSLVKVGRSEAAEALRRLAQRDPELRPDAEDYLAILGRDRVDWDDLAGAKAELEAARAK